ncbi:hypothetical protein MBLNU230_g5616t1 [Neophaeotheca triangularis]
MDSVNPIDPWAAPTTKLFALIGVVWLSLKIFSFWRLIASLLIIPGTKLSKFGPKGSWAVITGASDGIGKEYALQLAQRGFNVFLISRTQSKLDDLATTIQNTHNVQTRTHALDYASADQSSFTALKTALANLDIAILINNVGLSHSIPVPFVETSDQEMRDIIHINCTGTLRTTALIAPGMVTRNRGLILTMASFGGLMPTPLLATYSGSKAFLQQWSTALSAELAPHNVQVQLVQSYLVTSAMSKIRKSSAMVPNPKTFVKAALSRLGRSGGAQGIAATSTPYWAHGVMHWGIASFVGTMGGLVLGINKSMHVDIRKRALRKAEREGKKQ